METFNDKVSAIDLSEIIKKVCNKTGMSPEMAIKAEQLYRQYLTLRAKKPSIMIVPPKLADYVWHEHILHSKQYMADCNEIFGEYLHHTEMDDENALGQGWKNTQKLFIEEFGVNLIAQGQVSSPCT